MEVFQTIQQDIQVSCHYQVHFTGNLFDNASELFEAVITGLPGPSPAKVLVVVDRGVSQHHPRLLSEVEKYCYQRRSRLTLTGPPLLVEGGEGIKNNPHHVTQIHQAIHTAGLCRHSFVAAIGGGAVLDMVGLAAATAHRGIRLIRIPTTVMAQADAGVGVKNSINAFGKKNFIGTFAPPVAVINDFAFLTTLSGRDWISGVAEALKVALIKDASFFALLEAQAAALVERNLTVMQQVVHRCAALHLEHIAQGGDPFECGSSRPLDFGHWSAHKLEQLTSYDLRHGEAVAIGIALDATYSHLAGLLPLPDWQRIISVLIDLGFSLFHPALADCSNLLQGLDEFREHLGGELTIMLLTGIGQGFEVHRIEPHLVQAGSAVLRKIWQDCQGIRAGQGLLNLWRKADQWWPPRLALQSY